MRLRICLFATMMVTLSEPLAAHGVVWGTGGTADVLEFRYSSGEPMAYASIVVHGPADSLEFQSGRTDRNGRFAFSPDRDGRWVVVADDGMGHICTAELPRLSGGTDATPIDPFQASQIRTGWLLRTLFGFSLICNLAALAKWIGRRRRPLN